MQHHIPLADLGPHGVGMARAVTTCVHCGFCLAACPTYRVLGEEMDSPRGRIVLMKEALEGTLAISDVLPYVDRCLGCLGCETACPSGVRYRELVVPFLARAEKIARPATDRAWRDTMLSILESPARFRTALIAGWLARGLSPILPRRLQGILQLVPRRLPRREPLPEHVPAVGQRRARVALLAGCVQRVLRPAINSATLRLLSANGVEVIVPRDQGCCGALALHVGHDHRAQALEKHNASVFPSDVDAIVTNAAGCGSAMKEAEDRKRATDNGTRAAGDGRPPVRDVAEFLDTLGLRTPLAFAQPTTIAYHDACHLSHGQGVRVAPRALLQRIDKVTIAEIPDGEMCCGSAGLYNLEHPETAAELGRQKADAIRATGAQMVATGNIGCINQIEAHLSVPVRHTIEVLNSAYSSRG